MNAAENRLRVAMEWATPTCIGSEPHVFCKRGHLLEGDNVGITKKTGRRYCRRCEKERSRRRREQASLVNSNERC
jgi:hypothetical protein